MEIVAQTFLCATQREEPLGEHIGDFAFVDSVMGDHRARFLAGVDPFGSHFCSFQNELTKGLP